MEYLLSRKDIDNTKIVLFGRSLGGAVAIDLLSIPSFADRAFALIVENTFTSIPHMADQLVGGLKRLPMVCFRNQVTLNFTRVMLSCVSDIGERDMLCDKAFCRYYLR